MKDKPQPKSPKSPSSKLTSTSVWLGIVVLVAGVSWAWWRGDAWWSPFTAGGDAELRHRMDSVLHSLLKQEKEISAVSQELNRKPKVSNRIFLNTIIPLIMQ